MGSRQPATTTQTNTVQLSPEQQALFQQAMPFIQQYGSSPLPTLPTNLIAGFNANETAAQNNAVQMATGLGQQIGVNAANANNFLMDPSILSPDSNPYLRQHGEAITQSMTQNLMENILPGIRAGSTVNGGMYSGGNTGEAISTGLGIDRTQQQIGGALSGLYNNAYNTGLSTMMDATRLAPLTQQGLLFGSTVQGQVGGQQRAMEQAQLDAANQTSLLQGQLPFLRAQDILSLMQGMPGGSGVSTVTGAQPRSSGIMSGLGGAASGAAMGSMFGPWGTAIGGGIGLLGGLLG